MPTLAAALVAVFVVAGIGWTAIYALLRWDGLHWGSVIVHSMEICTGAAPYRDVPIFYGPVPFYIFCGVGSVFGFSYLMVGLATMVAYAANIIIWCLIGARLSFYRSTIIAFILFTAVIHPFILYPWYDYFAGMFFGAGILIALFAPSARPYAILSAAMFSLAVLSRLSYAIVVLVTLVVLPALAVITIRSAFRIAAWGAIIAAFFFVGLYLGYGITPSFVVDEALSSTLYISSAFPGFLNKFGRWFSLTPEIIFTASVLIGTAYFIESTCRGQHNRAALALYVISIVSFALHTHIFEFFRMISGAPFILLLGIQIALQTFSQPENPFRSTPLTSGAIAVGSGWIILALGSAIYAYPYATGSRLRLGDVGSISLTERKSIEGVTIYDRKQQRFYEKVRRLCRGRTVINQTSDVLIARACRDNPILLTDWLYETSIELAAERPALYARLTSQPQTLEDGEVLFTYAAPAGDLVSIGSLRNKLQDFAAFPINVLVRKDATPARGAD